MDFLPNHRRAITFVFGAVLFGAGFLLWRPSPEATAIADDTAEEKKDAFAVPETDDVTELLEFIEDIRDQRPPQPRGPAEYRAYVKYQRNAPMAIAEAAKKILDKAEKKSVEYADASAYLLESKVMGFREADEEGREEILKEVQQHLKDYGVRRDEAGIAYGISQAIEGQNPKLAAKAYGEFAKLVAASDDAPVTGHRGADGIQADARAGPDRRAAARPDAAGARVDQFERHQADAGFSVDGGQQLALGRSARAVAPIEHQAWRGVGLIEVAAGWVDRREHLRVPGLSLCPLPRLCAWDRPKVRPT